MTKDNNSKSLFLNIHLDVERYIEDGYDPLEIAACLNVASMGIYRHCLDADSYQRIAQEIYNSRDRVK